MYTKTKHYILILLIFTLGALSLFPQAESQLELTLETAVELAIEQGPKIEQAELEFKKAARAYEHRYSVYMPGLSLSTGLSMGGGLFINADESSIFESDSSRLSVRAGVNLPLDPDNGLSVEIAKNNYQQSQEELEYSKFTLKKNVRNSYFALLRLKDYVTQKERTYTQALERLSLSETKFSQGAISEQELLKARFSARSIEPELLQIKQDYLSLLRSFQRMLGLDTETEIVLQGTLSEFVTRSENILGEGVDLNSLYEIRAIQYAIKNLELQKDQLANNKLPSVSAGINWSTGLYPLFSGPDFDAVRDTLSISINLSFPISSWLPNSSTERSILDIEDSMKLLALKLEQSINEEKDAIDKLRASIQLHQKNIELNSQNLDLSIQILESTKTAWQAGRVKGEDLEDAEADVFNARVTLTNSRYLYLLSVSELHFLLNG